MKIRTERYKKNSQKWQKSRKEEKTEREGTRKRGRGRGAEWKGYDLKKKEIGAHRYT